MPTTSNHNQRSKALLRLTALWALNEAALGGLLHLFRSPFTGIFVGGSAVLLIALIAYWSEKPARDIPKALLVVLIIKAVVSPHAPLPAYVAVSFQGMLGALLFSTLPSFRLAAFLLGFLALVEAALQKLLITTLLFGMPLWESIDLFIDYILRKMQLLGQGSAAGSTWLIGLYVGVYALVGLAVGWVAGWLPKEAEKEAQQTSLPATIEVLSDLPAKERKPAWKKPWAWSIVGLLLFMTSTYYLVPAAQSQWSPIWLIVRTFTIIGIWYFLLSPAVMWLVRRFLRKQAKSYEKEVQEAMDMLPAFRQLIKTAWKETRALQGLARWRALLIRTIAYTLNY